MEQLINLITEVGISTLVVAGGAWFCYEQYKQAKVDKERMYSEMDLNNQRIYKELDENRKERKEFIKTLNLMNSRFEAVEGKLDQISQKLDK